MAAILTEHEHWLRNCPDCWLTFFFFSWGNIFSERSHKLVKRLNLATSAHTTGLASNGRHPSETQSRCPISFSYWHTKSPPHARLREFIFLVIVFHGAWLWFIYAHGHLTFKRFTVLSPFLYKYLSDFTLLSVVTGRSSLSLVIDRHFWGKRRYSGRFQRISSLKPSSATQ